MCYMIHVLTSSTLVLVFDSKIRVKVYVFLNIGLLSFILPTCLLHFKICCLENVRLSGLSCSKAGIALSAG